MDQVHVRLHNYSLLLGIYTLIFIQALCMRIQIIVIKCEKMHWWKLPGKLFSKRNKTLYLSALILLWISTITSLACIWADIRAGFVVNNNSILGILDGFKAAPRVLEAITTLVNILTADAILVSSVVPASVFPLQIWRYGAAISCGEIISF